MSLRNILNKLSQEKINLESSPIRGLYPAAIEHELITNLGVIMLGLGAAKNISGIIRICKESIDSNRSAWVTNIEQTLLLLHNQVSNPLECILTEINNALAGLESPQPNTDQIVFALKNFSRTTSEMEASPGFQFLAHFSTQGHYLKHYLVPEKLIPLAYSFADQSASLNDMRMELIECQVLLTESLSALRMESNSFDNSATHQLSEGLASIGMLLDEALETEAISPATSTSH